MAVRKKKARAKKKAAPSGWGGRRKGAGRPKGSGKGPSPDARYNRVAVMFNNDEIKTLQSLAKKKGLPVATVAYQLIARSLKRKA